MDNKKIFDKIVSKHYDHLGYKPPKHILGVVEQAVVDVMDENEISLEDTWNPEICIRILLSLVEDELYMTKGHRNNDAVDTLIALGALLDLDDDLLECSIKVIDKYLKGNNLMRIYGRVEPYLYSYTKGLDSTSQLKSMKTYLLGFYDFLESALLELEGEADG